MATDRLQADRLHGAAPLLVRKGWAATLRDLIRRFPAVTLVGARQAGKTTLARRTFPRAAYYDLERPSDRARIELDPEAVLGRARGIVVIDEAQAMPALFPVLRSLIDERKTGRRFVLLGSASPLLVRGVSETLAGRIAHLELPPFSWDEVPARRESDAERIWLTGGFPPAYFAPDAKGWWLWLENYIRNFIERDLGLLGIDLPAPRLHRFARIIANVHGGLWNAAEVGGALGVSYHTAQRYLEILEGGFLVRILKPWHANLGKRLVKQPRLYWRDSGLLHHLLGLDAPAAILDHPKAGASWEGFIIEEVISRERRRHPSTEFHFFRTHTGLECDLLLVRGRTLLPLEVKIATSVGRDDLDRLKAVMELIGARRGHIVANVREKTTAAGITIWNAQELLRGKAWL